MRSVAENLFEVLSWPFEFYCSLFIPRPLVIVFVFGRLDYDCMPKLLLVSMTPELGLAVFTFALSMWVRISFVYLSLFTISRLDDSIALLNG